jgi:hypothetical protein
MSDKKDLRRLFQEQLPRATPEEAKKKSAAQRRLMDQLRTELEELEWELEAQGRTLAPVPWPGAIEPLVLAAAFLLRGEGDVDSIAEKITELTSEPYRVGQIRFIVHRLVRRRLLSEHERSFTITPQGEHELAQARADAKRWIDALGEWPGPAATIE